MVRVFFGWFRLNFQSEDRAEIEVSWLSLKESRVDDMIKVGRNPLTTLSLLASGLLRFILLGLLYRLRGCPLALLVGAGSSRSCDWSGLGWFSGLALTLPGRLGLGRRLGDRLLNYGRDGSRCLQLLGHDGAIIDNLGLDTNDVGHRDVKLLAVANGLIIRHLLGGQVAGFVRMHPGVVEPQIVLVCLVPALEYDISDCTSSAKGGKTYQLLLNGHGSPTTLALFLDSTLGNTFTKIGGDDGTGCLHVEEVGGQGALGSIGIMLALLALLLLFNGRNRDGQWNRARLNIEHAKVLVLLRETTKAVIKRGLAQQQICLRKVFSGEGANDPLNGGQTLVDL